MKSLQLLLTFLVLLWGNFCVKAQSNRNIISLGTSQISTKNEALATFAGGCFWHTEIVFQSLVGVRDAVCGYAGGQTPNPTYDAVNTGSTGHAECVNVYYDPQKISYQQLVMAYFASVNPTTLNRQDNDVGTQYRTIVFYRTDIEKSTIIKVMQGIVQSKKYHKPIVTTLMPFSIFYEAEKYHQEYAFNNPTNRYIQSTTVPALQSFMKSFKGKFKVVK